MGRAGDLVWVRVDQEGGMGRRGVGVLRVREKKQGMM